MVRGLLRRQLPYAHTAVNMLVARSCMRTPVPQSCMVTAFLKYEVSCESSCHPHIGKPVHRVQIH